MKKNYLLYLLLLILCFIVACDEQTNEQSNKEEHENTAKKENHDSSIISKQHINNSKYIKAAHYFASSWPKTFWEEFEKADVDKDLTRIKNDGFNTIVLVLPWMGFELDFKNEKTTSDERMYQRLNYLLSKITSHNLDYILRLGFPHAFSSKLDTNAIELCTKMYEEPKQQKHWNQYLLNVKKSTDKYNDKLVGVLVSWEDFWCPHFVFPYKDDARRKELAQNTGYASWLFKKDITTLKMVLGKNDIKESEVRIPKKQDMDYFYYIEFIDKKFDELILESTKAIFPMTAMEIRTDKDPAVSSSGEKIWVEHKKYFNEPNHRGTYWAPFWGAQNNGEKLSVKQALHNFKYFLNYITNNGKSINHVIEQFNFTDNTPYFPNNATMNDEDIPEFLINSIPLLKKYSTGYGVWAYHDYADNALYNSSFEFGLDGWNSDKATITGNENDQQVKLSKGGFISQTYTAHEHFMLARSYDTIQLCINSKVKGSITTYANDKKINTIDLTKGVNCYSLPSESLIKSPTNFKIKANTDLVVDEIKLYGFVQKLGLYDEFNKESAHLETIRIMNKQL